MWANTERVSESAWPRSIGMTEARAFKMVREGTEEV